MLLTNPLIFIFAYMTTNVSIGINVDHVVVDWKKRKK